MKNARAATSATLGHGRSVETVRLVELPEAERGPILRAFIRKVRGGRRFFDTTEADAVVATAGRYPVFRVDRAESTG